jgi:hypothetical protein
MCSQYRRAPRTFRVVADAEIRDEDLPLSKRPPNPELQRIEFASLVIRKLVDPEARVAVLDEHGRPALVSCKERLYELLASDHPIVGIYAQGASIPDVIDDLKAAGL